MLFYLRDERAEPRYMCQPGIKDNGGFCNFQLHTLCGKSPDQVFLYPTQATSEREFSLEI